MRGPGKGQRNQIPLIPLAKKDFNTETKTDEEGGREEHKHRQASQGSPIY